MKNLTLTDTYTQRKQLMETFTKECEAIFVFLKDKYARFPKVTIGWKIIETPDPNMLYGYIAILDISTRICVRIWIRCTADISFHIYNGVRADYKNADHLLNSRFFEDSDIFPDKIIEKAKLHTLIDNPLQFADLLQSIASEVVV